MDKYYYIYNKPGITNLKKATVENDVVTDDYAEKKVELVTVNIIAMDAKIYNNANKPQVILYDINEKPIKSDTYDINVLITYIRKAYNGFTFAKNYDLKKNKNETNIETGLWGVDINNNNYFMLAVQLIAAILSGVKIKFCFDKTYPVSDGNLVKYTKYIVNKIRNITPIKHNQ